MSLATDNVLTECLDRYELEPYILLEAKRLGHRFKEVLVHGVDPPRSQGYTKTRPISDWWSVLRPISLKGLSLRK